MKLGRLEPVSAREVWADEARDFTPWLANDSNIALLGETIGIELEVEATEKSVGPFKADILCKDTSDGHYVLIENQLEKTNHTHMGQLITYASGLHAATIVWIADPFRDEHRAALDWLNEITGDDFRFFGLEVEVWKIGDSQLAPKFNIVSKPNDWSDSAISSTNNNELSETKKMQLEFWTKLREVLDESGTTLPGTKPRPQHWNTFSIGRSDFGLAASMNTQSGFIRASINCRLRNREAHYALLYEEKEQLESELGEAIEWEPLPGKKVKRIAVYLRGVDFADRSQWDGHLSWVKERLVRLDKVFRKRLKDLDADDYDPEDELS